MQAVIMAGGKGTRLRPLTVNRPKPMVPIVNIPMLEHTILKLKQSGVDEIFLTLQYLADMIKNYFGDGSKYGVKIHYSVEERPMGTAGGIKLLEDKLDDRFLVVSGDVLTSADFSEFIKFHESKGGKVSIMLTRVPNPLQYGIVMIDNDSRITMFLEKPGWGRVFSDTINTGTYLIEKEVLAHVPKSKEYDFGKQLFPLLLKKGVPMYGYLMTGYWCDIGLPETYLKVHQDILRGIAGVEIRGNKMGEGIWVGEGTKIADDVEITPPVVIGTNVRIESGAVIDRFSVIGNGVVIKKNAYVSKSVIWDFTTIGEGANINGAAIGARVLLGKEVTVLEKAVVGDDTEIGERALIQPGIKIWPERRIEAHSIVNTNIRWGSVWKKSIFSEYGITGIPNVVITPSFATSLGAAFGTFLGQGSKVVMGRDFYTASRMIKRALSAGLQSVGVDIYNLRGIPVSVVQHMIIHHRAKGGIYTTFDPVSKNMTIRFFDSNGVDLATSHSRKVEEIMFKESYKIADINNIGNIIYPTTAPIVYMNKLLSMLDQERIREKEYRIVVDYNLGAAANIVTAVLTRLNAELFPLNSPYSYDETPPSHKKTESIDFIKTLRAVEGDIGVLYSVDGESLILVDEHGIQIYGDQELMLFAKLALEDGARKLVVPVSATSGIEELAERYDARIERVPIGRRYLEAAVAENKADFAGNERGGFAFAKFGPFLDGIASSLMVIEYMAKTGNSLSEIVRGLPSFYQMKESIECPIEYRGAVMRKLMDRVSDQKIDIVDGIKVYHDEGWVLIIPSKTSAAFEVYAESKKKEITETLLNEYVDILKDTIYKVEVERF